MSTGPYAPPGSQPGDDGAREGVSQAAEQAQEKAQEFAGQAQQQAQQAAGQAKTRLREQIDQRSSQAADQINRQAGDLRAVSSSLREQGKTGPAGAADKLAEYAEKVGGYLSDRDSDRLLSDAEDFGRRQPWAIAAGGLALGFAASRFLKASSSRRYSSRYGDGAAPTPNAGGGGLGSPYTSPGSPYTPPGGRPVPVRAPGTAETAAQPPYRSPSAVPPAAMPNPPRESAVTGPGAPLQPPPPRSGV